MGNHILLSCRGEVSKPEKKILLSEGDLGFSLLEWSKYYLQLPFTTVNIVITINNIITIIIDIISLYHQFQKWHQKKNRS